VNSLDLISEGTVPVRSTTVITMFVKHIMMLLSQVKRKTLGFITNECLDYSRSPTITKFIVKLVDTICGSSG
jgi:hypothetical protein